MNTLIMQPLMEAILTFGSFAETALSISKAQTETPTQQAIPDYIMIIVYAAIAIIVAVIISVVIVGILILRKK